MGLFDIFRSQASKPEATRPEKHLLPGPESLTTKSLFSVFVPKAYPAPSAPRVREDVGLFAPFAPGTSKPRSFAEAVVPAEEHGSLFETESEKDLFEAWREEPSGAPAVPPREARAQAAARAHPMASWLDKIFDLVSLWNKVRAARETPKFQWELRRAQDPNFADIAGAEVFEFAPAGDDDRDLQIAWMLGIGAKAVEDALRRGDLVFGDLLAPELDRVRDALNEIAPWDLKGRFEFGDYDDGGFGLLYFEDPLQRLR